MKQVIIAVAFGCLLLSCKKDKNIVPVQKSFYESTGNLIVLKIGDSLECAYEYNMSSIALSNDSLPLFYEVDSNYVWPIKFLKFTPNPDTIIRFASDVETKFYTPLIEKNSLKVNTQAISYNESNFQAFDAPIPPELESKWSEVSKLDIVKQYREANPTAKIGIQKVILKEIDLEHHILTSKLKFLIYLVK